MLKIQNYDVEPDHPGLEDVGSRSMMVLLRFLGKQLISISLKDKIYAIFISGICGIGYKRIEMAKRCSLIT